MERRTYANPPIVEALCTFNFSTERPWNLTIPGRFFEQVKADYPEDPEEEVKIQAQFGSGNQVAQFKVGGAATRVILKNGPKRVGILPNSLSIHSLAPYEGWESLRARALSALDAYHNVVGDHQIESIGLRYVNRIFIPASKISFNDYFTVAQGLPSEGFPGGITSFFDKMEITYPDAPAKIVFTWASDDEVADQVAFIMDFDLQRLGPITREDVPELLDDLRERERAAFESLILDRLREIFDAAH
ncbi:TIGR04255 family protein [Streptomyces sp. NPDC091027]|uniref:TIGR04255 family protein n=1 Tax=Streptomyces sp. NPDC091027 TaxID=3365971 RepID=UPI0037FCD0E5